MTAIDQAFIRAYVQDDIGVAPAGFHVGVSANTADTIGVHIPPSASEGQGGGTAVVEAPAPRIEAPTPPVEAPAVVSPRPEAAAAPVGADDRDQFEPLLQVDGFAWPQRVASLTLAAGIQLERLADGISAETTSSGNVVALGACRRGQGCTTLLLCAAKRLAAKGLKVVVVDADFENPMLARRLGLSPEAGWEAVLLGRLSLEDVLIESVEDKIDLLPLVESAAEETTVPADAPDPAGRLELLRKHYDLVLVDLGEFGADLGTATGKQQRHWIDSAVLVHDVRNTPQAEVTDAARRVRKAGIANVSIVENFV